MTESEIDLTFIQYYQAKKERENSKCKVFPGAILTGVPDIAIKFSVAHCLLPILILTHIACVHNPTDPFKMLESQNQQSGEFMLVRNVLRQLVGRVAEAE